MNPMSEQEYQDFARQASWTMRAQMEENRKTFQLDTFKRFDWDPWRGELVFSSGGIPKVVAKIQVVGSLTAKSNVWAWAWANPGLLASVRKAAQRAQEFGTERGVVRMNVPKWSATESDAWEMTAVTARLSEAVGAFRCPGKDGVTYMIFTEIRAVSDRKRIFGARICSHVLEEDQPILLLSRELDGEVLAMCGGENDSAATTRDLPLDRLLQLDPSLMLLADMPDGWVALRASPEHDWVPSKAE